MKQSRRIPLAAAVAAGLMVAGVAPAMANQAPAEGSYSTFTGDLYGSEPYTDGGGYHAGVITDGSVDLTIDQAAGYTIKVVSIDLGHSINLTDGDVSVSCEGTPVSPTVKLSGDEISIKGLSCADGADGNSTIDVVVAADNLEGSTDSMFFDGGKIEAQYRTNDNRRYKDYGWRIKSYNLDFQED